MTRNTTTQITTIRDTPARVEFSRSAGVIGVLVALLALPLVGLIYLAFDDPAEEAREKLAQATQLLSQRVDTTVAEWGTRLQRQVNDSAFSLGHYAESHRHPHSPQNSPINGAELIRLNPWGAEQMPVTIECREQDWQTYRRALCEARAMRPSANPKNDTEDASSGAADSGGRERNEPSAIEPNVIEPNAIELRTDDLTATALIAKKEIYSDAYQRLKGSPHPGARSLCAELILKIALQWRQLGNRSAAIELLEHYLPSFGNLPSPDSLYPVEFRSAALLMELRPGLTAATLAAEKREHLWQQRDLLALSTLNTLLDWLASSPEQTRAQPQWQQYLNDRQSRRPPPESIPIPFAGDPIVVATSHGCDIYLFQAVTPPDNATTFVDSYVGRRLRVDSRQALMLAGSSATTAFATEAPLASPVWHSHAPAESRFARSVQVTLPPARGDSTPTRLGWLELRSSAIPEWEAQIEALEQSRNLSLILAAVVAVAATLALVTHVRRENERVRTRAQWLEHVAHELRTPAAALGIYSDLLLDRNLPTELENRYLRMLAAESQRVGYVVENVLDLSLASPHSESTPESVDLQELLERIVKVFGPRCEEDGIELRAEIAELPHIVSFPRSIARIVFNLIDNAVKYRRRGEPPSFITVAASHTAGNHTASSGDEVEVRVGDNGQGVPEEHRRRIFDHGFRLDEKIPGSGVGLAISAQLAQRLGGSLELLPTQPGVGGSIFLLRVPLKFDSMRIGTKTAYG